MAGHDDDGEQQQQQQHLVPEHDAQHTEHDGAGRGDGITDHVGADDAARTDTPLGVDGDMHGDNVALLTYIRDHPNPAAPALADSGAGAGAGAQKRKRSPTDAEAVEAEADADADTDAHANGAAAYLAQLDPTLDPSLDPSLSEMGYSAGGAGKRARMEEGAAGADEGEGADAGAYDPTREHEERHEHEHGQSHEITMSTAAAAAAADAEALNAHADADADAEAVADATADAYAEGLVSQLHAGADAGASGSAGGSAGEDGAHGEVRRGRGSGKREVKQSKRAEQNRKAQQNFRKRREEHIKDLEIKIAEYDQLRREKEVMDNIVVELRIMLESARMENAGLRSTLLHAASQGARLIDDAGELVMHRDNPIVSVGLGGGSRLASSLPIGGGGGAVGMLGGGGGGSLGGGGSSGAPAAGAGGGKSHARDPAAGDKPAKVDPKTLSELLAAMDRLAGKTQVLARVGVSAR